MPSQWENLFQNAGTWKGCFTRLSPDGTVESETPSRLTLERLGEQSARFELIRYPEGKDAIAHQSQFQSLARSGLFCNDGSFTKGSMQWSPVADFGTEFSLTLPNERLRLVQMYERGGTLSYLVLIQETREGQTAVVRPKLTVEQLIGTWEGSAIAYNLDWTTASFSTQLTVTQPTPQSLRQELCSGEATFTSTARLERDRLLFEQGQITYQLLLLPNGGSSLCPQQIPNVTGFVCEIGWLLDAKTRLRLVRQYDSSGAWSQQTWIKETKVA